MYGGCSTFSECGVGKAGKVKVGNNLEPRTGKPLQSKEPLLSFKPFSDSLMAINVEVYLPIISRALV